MRMNTNQVALIALLLLSLLLLSISPVRATGPFDQACSNCHGTGTVIRSSTITCAACQGTGKVTTTNTCDVCKGTGQITVVQTCSTCGGSGKVTPSVVTKSTNGYGTLSGLDWVARVEIVVQNEEDEGTYCVAESQVKTVSETYYHTSSRTYLKPHTDVKMTIDTPEIGILTDWTWSIYLKSVDSITCKACQGSGGSSTIATCENCKGSGTVTTTNTCTNCQGTGKVTTQESITCPTCNGSGFVTNWTNVSIVAVVIIGLIAAGVATVAIRRKAAKH